MQLLFFFAASPAKSEKQGSHRSGRFDGKRRNDRTPASFPGSCANRGNEACEVHSDAATARENSTALTQRRQLQKCSCCFSLPRRQPSQRNGTEQKKRKLPQLKSNRRFGLKRRSDRAHAGFRRRAIPGDGSAAREIRDDASTALTQRRQTRFHGCRLSFIAFLLFSVFLSAFADGYPQSAGLLPAADPFLRGSSDGGSARGRNRPSPCDADKLHQ